MERLLNLVHTSNYYHLLLFHGGVIDKNGNLETIKWDFRALETVVKSLGAQVIFSSILHIRVKNEKYTDSPSKKLALSLVLAIGF